MALTDLLEQHGVTAADRTAVFELLRRLPLAGRARVQLWGDYLQSRGEAMTDGERQALSA